MKNCMLVYRGPLERARLSYIIESIKLVSDRIVFVWIFPGELSAQRRDFSKNYLDQYSFQETIILEHRWKDFFKTKRLISKKVNDEKPNFIALVGFSSLIFGTSVAGLKRIWFINGIPEEKSLHGNKLTTSITGWLQWQLQLHSGVRADLIVTVSNRMKKMVEAKRADVRIFSAPTCVDISTFRTPVKTERRYFTYLGSGAPWQALDMLSNVWQRIHVLDKGILFRVVSRDERCKVLAQGIDKQNIEFVQSNDFNKVAAFLNESVAGFLLRKDDIVNRVSFPTKLAEYLASGCWVISTALDWDISDYFSRYNIGVLLPLSATADEMAADILKFNQQMTPRVKTDIINCADELDRERWKKLLVDEIVKLFA